MSHQKTLIQAAIDRQGTIVAQGPISSFMAPASKQAQGGLRFVMTPREKYCALSSIERCNDFARLRGLQTIDAFLATVDLFAAHTNDHPIDFEAMHASPDIGDVMEFIGGVGVRIDRRTGRLADNWRGKFHVIVS